MATITPILDTRTTRASGLYPVVIRVINGKQQKKISTGFRIEPKHWQKNRVSNRHPESAIINAKITALLQEISQYVAECRLAGRSLDLGRLERGYGKISFPAYLERRAGEYLDDSKIVLHRKVKRHAVEIREALGEIMPADLGAESLRKLESFMIRAGNQDSTRQKKFRHLRQLFGQMIKEGLAIGPNPFDDHKITARPVRKEKLSFAELERVESLPLVPGPLAVARDCFLFSYYAKGLRFANCVTLRSNAIREGRLWVQPDKRGNPISIKLHAKLEAILERYAGGKFLLPVLDRLPEDPAARLDKIASANVVVNRNLKTVAAMAEIPVRISMHMARHTFAYHLKVKSGRVDVVQDALGHHMSRTTEIYLKSLEDELIDGEVAKLYGD